MDFSLLYFANREVDDPPREYDLLLRAARFADEHGFTALWLPERHFHPFGGAYPNPALAAAALATVTSRVRLRAGSVVLPLHDPLTVVEDWAFVDNLSRGRVDLAIATGWNPNDFVIAPDGFADRRARLPEQIGQLRDIWAGKAVTRRNGAGDQVEITTYPRPAQEEVELWLTCSASLGTFELAGALGANVLTALLFQRVEELAPKLAAYHAALTAHGHDPAARKVTLMVHTFVGDSDDAVRATVREPFIRYLRSSVDLWKARWTELGAIKEDRLLGYAFERYFRTAALFGSVDRCAEFVAELREVGVTEVAALIDFGVPAEETVAALSHLDELRRRVG
ncbi:MupA/Atu3671 family FMN-dependent luciferase-like monooxygenase [Actinokineospora iranica]|uniref:Natural product biosynthesis luciferase-like monooxygenase domain-containing protein n=1 Tax=Actinokineospora iranica TaxID=1271860 RepID=A0A1G6U5E3_9PSEU|nr:MupA/Atu3671 family FMN-dependent luciferase-like monooxygenase [Actinokineospora iranica]SDD36539.1 natural product biosynthesis luciferase-like monooxygenase domain-containing protein [Actinokineospora iranica]